MTPFARSSSPEREGYSRIGVNGRSHRIYSSHLIASAALIVCALLLAAALITVLAVRTTFKTSHHHPINLNHLLQSTTLLFTNETSDELPVILNTDVEVAYLRARKDVLEEARLEKSFVANNQTSQASLFHLFLNDDDPESRKESSNEGKIRERATRIIKEKFHLTRLQVSAGLRINGSLCSNESVGSCNETYRSYNGSCNNLLHASWGVAKAAYRRVLTPDYADGISEPRISFDHVRSLPSARVVSSKIHLDSKPVRDHDRSLLMTFFGEFVAHDISKVAPISGAPTSCGHVEHPDCYPINVTSDPFYSSVNVTCLPFVRSRVAVERDWVLGSRQQMNLVTSYLDGSVIYGSSKEKSLALRTLNGQLKFSRFNDQILMPMKGANSSSFCSLPSSNKSCFAAGDSRCNENLLLASLHTIWLREHNRISVALHELNPSWSDDRLFEESRRLVVAELQHVTYREYLPKLLGVSVLSKFGLRLETNAYYTNYSVNVDPTIGTEFATAAFRFGHSTVSGLLQLLDSDGVKHVQLSKTWFTPSTIKREGHLLAGFLRGAAEQIPLSVGLHYNKQLGNRLFQGKWDNAGLDLAAIDIQRGRDHGIPSYNRFRKFCGLSELRSEKDLRNLFGREMADKFLEVYGNIEDIDLMSGGLGEPHVAGGMLGPTFACLVGDQFSRLRQSDRYWYENGLGVAPIPFSKEQLAEIRKTSLARIICDNVPQVKNLQPDVFSVPFERNSPVPCTSNRIPQVDVVYWYDADENYDIHYEDDETEE